MLDDGARKTPQGCFFFFLLLIFFFPPFEIPCKSMRVTRRVHAQLGDACDSARDVTRRGDAKQEGGKREKGDAAEDRNYATLRFSNTISRLGVATAARNC